jgi:hypothetical protein
LLSNWLRFVKSASIALRSNQTPLRHRLLPTLPRPHVCGIGFVRQVSYDLGELASFGRTRTLAASPHIPYRFTLASFGRFRASFSQKCASVTSLRVRRSVLTAHARSLRPMSVKPLPGLHCKVLGGLRAHHANCDRHLGASSRINLGRFPSFARRPLERTQ